MQRKAKIGSACIEIKIEKNSSVAQLVEMIRHAHHKSWTSASGQLTGGPIASQHTRPRTALLRIKQDVIKSKKLNIKDVLALNDGNDIYHIFNRYPAPPGPDLIVSTANLVQHLPDMPETPKLRASLGAY